MKCVFHGEKKNLIMSFNLKGKKKIIGVNIVIRKYNYRTMQENCLYCHIIS